MVAYAGGWLDGAGVGGVIGAGARLTALEQSQIVVANVRTYGGAKGDFIADDTAAIQRTIDAVHTAGGGIVFFPPGNYRVGLLGLYTDVMLVGAGRNVSKLNQLVTANPIIVMAASTGQQNVYIVDLLLTAYNNQALNQGGIKLLGVTKSKIERCLIGFTNGYAVQIAGGSVQGDAMHNTIDGNDFENVVGVAVELKPDPAGGSHPDSTVIFDNLFNGSVFTAIQLDPPAAISGALGCDGCQITHNRFQSTPGAANTFTAVDICGQGNMVAFNRGEVMNGFLRVAVHAAVAGAGSGTFTSAANGFGFNEWATYGDPTKFTWDDQGQNTHRISERVATGIINEFGSDLRTKQGRTLSRSVKSGTTYAAQTFDDYLAMSNVAARAVTLYAANLVNPGHVIAVKDTAGTAGAANITVTPAGGDTIDGAATYVINTNRGVVRLMSNGANGWDVI